MNKHCKEVSALSFNKLIILAYNWRLQKGGVRPRTLEEHIRNINNYCDYAKKLN